MYTRPSVAAMLIVCTTIPLVAQTVPPAPHDFTFTCGVTDTHAPLSFRAAPSIVPPTIPPGPPPVVDILLLHTPHLVTSYAQNNSETSPEERIAIVADAGITYLNEALAASNIPGQVRSAGIVMVDYDDTGDSLHDDIDWLRASVRRSDEDTTDGLVARLRKEAGADLVALLGTPRAADVAGVASVGGPVSVSMAGFGFAHIFAHEVGHNLGMLHNIEDTGVSDPSNVVPSYRFGWIEPPGDDREYGMLSIMSYQATCREVSGTLCQRIPIFSNPDVMIDGFGEITFNPVPAGNDYAANAYLAMQTMYETATWSTPCPISGTLRLHDERFDVSVTWRDFDGNTGVGTVVPSCTSDSGLFWFFDPNNWELLVKVLDGCGVNGHYWVFAAATTTVEYTLRVTDWDAPHSNTKIYRNPLGTAAVAIADTDAFATCP